MSHLAPLLNGRNPGGQERGSDRTIFKCPTQRNAQAAGGQDSRIARGSEICSEFGRNRGFDDERSGLKRSRTDVLKTQRHVYVIQQTFISCFVFLHQWLNTDGIMSEYLMVHIKKFNRFMKKKLAAYGRPEELKHINYILTLFSEEIVRAAYPH